MNPDTVEAPMMPLIDDVLITLRADAIANRRAYMPWEDLVAVTPLTHDEGIQVLTSIAVGFLDGKLKPSAEGMRRLQAIGPHAMMGYEE